MKTAITITARMKSTRLPLKVLRLINGVPVIEHLVNRLKQSKLANEIIMCTSTNPQDEILVDYAQKLKIKHFRGDEDDVLKRLYDGAMENDIDYIVSTTADNPLTDPVYADKILQSFHEGDYDYITINGLPLGTFSYGLKVKAIKTVLEKKKETNTEIWGVYFKDSPVFRRKVIDAEKEVYHPEFRLTVDLPEDLEVMRVIFKNLQKDCEIFSLRAVVEFLEAHPEVVSINKNITQRQATTYTKID
ncbi:MAG: NTP transferase domain-containing protein [Candidatus Sigynarchaeota archaeon]